MPSIHIPSYNKAIRDVLYVLGVIIGVATQSSTVRAILIVLRDELTNLQVIEPPKEKTDAKAED